MKHDRLKSIVLVLLIGLNVILTGGVLSKMYDNDEQTMDNTTELKDIELDITDYLNPQNFTISFGGNDYSVFYSEPSTMGYGVPNMINIWNISKIELKKFFRGVYEYEFIKKEDYDKAKQFKSIALQLGYEIPANEFISAISELDEKDRSLNDRIDTILIPATDNQIKNIYLTNSKGSKYIKFTGNDKSENILLAINSLKDVASKEIIYKTLKDSLGNTENDTIVPFIPKTEVNNISLPAFIANSVDLDDKKTITSYAYSFFGNDLSFTKEIAETDGTIIYMYGYGDKILRINKDGLVEYFDNQIKGVDSIEYTFDMALKRAVDFVMNRNDFPFKKDEIFLSNYEYDDKQKTYKFAFGYRLKNYQIGMLLGKDSRFIEVEIKNDRVIYFKSMIKTAGLDIVNEEEKIIGWLDVIRENIDLIKKNYYASRNIDTEKVLSDKFPVIDYINNVMISYYLVGDEFKPAWKIGIDDIVYYFDIYDGTNYTYYKRQTSGDKNELE